MWDSARASILAFLLAALCGGAELPGKGVVTHALGSSDALALGGRMLAIVSPRSITMLDLDSANESCVITLEPPFTMACGGDAVITHQTEHGLLQIWDPISGKERRRLILKLGSTIRMQMAAGNARLVAMLWRHDHSCAGVFDLETGRLHPIRAREIGELLGIDRDCQHLLIRRQDEVYRVDLTRPLPKRLDAHAVVSGRPEAWPGGSSLVVDGHLIDHQRQFIARRPSRGEFVPSLHPDRYGWFDNGRRLVHIYRFDGSRVVTIPIGRTGHPAVLTDDRLVMRQRNQQRIYPLTVEQQQLRYLQPGELWVARLKIGSDAKVQAPPGMEVDVECRSLLWRVPADYARQPFPVTVRVQEDGKSRDESFLVHPLRERSMPDLLRYLWLRLHYDVRNGDAVLADQRLAALLPHIDNRTAVPLTLTHIAKTPLGDHIRGQLAPHFLVADPVAANLLLAAVASRREPGETGRHLLAALASRPIIPAHDSVIARVMTHFADSAVPPTEITEFAKELRSRLANVDARLTRRYSELWRWLEERKP
jgi:hypothetical protein